MLLCRKKINYIDTEINFNSSQTGCPENMGKK